MTYAIPSCLIATAFFLAFVLSLALSPKTLKKFTGWAILFSAATGLLLYGLGFGTAAHSPAEALVAALQAGSGTLWLFGGRESFDALCASAEWFQNAPILQFLFWIAYLSAVYVTASAIMNALGQRLLRRMRQKMLPLFHVCVFYGAGGETLALAETLQSQGRRLRPLFIWRGEPAELETKADRLGGIVWPEDKIDPGGRWLKQIGLKPGNNKTVDIICIYPDDGCNQSFLSRVISSVMARKLPAPQIHISAVSEWEFPMLADLKPDDGQYPAVDTFTRGELAARCLMEQAPPWKFMEFDASARAVGNFTALVIGFGNVGQNVLRYLIQNAQFAGGSFSAVVVDKTQAAGTFRALYGDMLERYHVSFLHIEADSADFVTLLRKLAPELRYVAVCSGNEKTNREIVRQIRLLQTQCPKDFSHRMALARCVNAGVTLCDGNAERFFPSLTLNDLLTGKLDHMAQAVNSAYLSKTANRLYPTDSKARKQYYRNSWYQLNVLSRLSSRASAAFLPAMYAAAGVDPDNPDAPIRIKDRLAQADVLESLSRTEHLRWNAFHSTMGVTQMPPEEFYRRTEESCKFIIARMPSLEKLAARAEALPAGEAENLLARAEALSLEMKRSASKVRKDIPEGILGGIHACLADWDELALLWQRYEKLDGMLNHIDFLMARTRYLLTGKGEPPEVPVSRSFQQLDTDMVLRILELGDKE